MALSALVYISKVMYKSSIEKASADQCVHQQPMTNFYNRVSLDLCISRVRSCTNIFVLDILMSNSH